MKLDQLLSSLKTEGPSYFGLATRDPFSRQYLSHPSGCNMSGYTENGKVQLFMNFADLPVGTPVDLEELPLNDIQQAWIIPIPEDRRELCKLVNQILFSGLELEPLSQSNLNQLGDRHPTNILYNANELLFEKNQLRNRLLKTCRHIHIEEQAPQVAEKLAEQTPQNVLEQDRNSFNDDGTVSFHKMKKTRLSKKYIDLEELDSFMDLMKEREKTRPQYAFLKKYFQLNL